MGFFFNDAPKPPPAAKKTAARDIPIHSLQKLGCQACPRNDDRGLRTPKMAPAGSELPMVYLLGAAPSSADDEAGEHWRDEAGDAVYRAIGDGFMRAEVRSGTVTQCAGPQTAVEVECCRQRVVADIERHRPLIVAGIGDAPLRWAVERDAAGKMAEKPGNLTAPNHRGTLIATRIGRHDCWYFPILYPNYVHKKRKFGTSEFELAVKHDAAALRRLSRELEAPRVWSSGFDDGVEIITGQKPGDMQRLEAALRELAAERRSALDVETTGLRPHLEFSHPKLDTKGHRILTCAVGTFRRVVAFAVDHPDGWGSEAQRARVAQLLLDYIVGSGEKAAHNLAMEMEWLAWRFGPELLRRTPWADTMAMAHTLDETPSNMGLDFQCRKRFGFWLKSQSRIDPARILDYPLPDVLRYNGMDAKWTDALRDALEPEVLADPKYEAEYLRKLRLAPTLVLTEMVGLEVDFKYADDMAKKFTDLTNDLAARIARCPEVRDYERRFGTFRPGNTDDVLRLLRDVCKREEVRVEERAGAVRWTTDEEALTRIPRGEVPSVPLILEHRGSSKLGSTYIDPVRKREIVGADGYIRCKYSSMVARTGRLNSEDPNNQNWPKRKFREIRGMIRARNGRWLVACDYGQIEFRVVGMASKDPRLVEYAWTGYDVHGDWAGRAIKAYPAIQDWIADEFADVLAAAKAKKQDVDKAMFKTLRQEMKNGWVFPQFFGASTRSCAERLHLPGDVADEMGEEFWEEFPVVRSWQEEEMRGYEENLYVETLGGRKRRGALTRNQVINLKVQGSAADIVLEAMNELSERADGEGDPGFQPALNVHDDLTFDLEDEGLEERIEEIARMMCKPRFDYVNVPLVVEVSVGHRWHELEEIKVYRSDELFGTPNPYKEKRR